MEKVLGIYGNTNRHWMGGGFPVRSSFSYSTLGQHISPFLLLDYTGPVDFSPAQQRCSVGQHPYCGLEAVIIAYQGEAEHRGSTGAGECIGPGGVQWIAAIPGILHEEYHSGRFHSTDGTLKVIQLWVNLPSSDKMNPSRYQTLLDASIPRVGLPDRVDELRVIIEHHGRYQGPTLTHSSLAVWDVQLKVGKHLVPDLPKGHTCAVVVLCDTLAVDDEIAREAQVAPLDRDDLRLGLEVSNNMQLLVLSDEPLGESIIGYGSFVTNSREEINQAIEDFENRRFIHAR